MKNLIDKYFTAHYAKYFAALRNSKVQIKEEQTTGTSFDLQDGSPYISANGSGKVSFGNPQGHNISVLGYDDYIRKLPGKFGTGRMRCDFIIEDKVSGIIVLDEITSTGNGIKGHTKPIKNRKNGKVHYQGGKLEKAQQQLLDTLQTLCEVKEIDCHFKKYNKKICLCSYKLCSSNVQSINNTLTAFNQGVVMTDGMKLSKKDIESLGFEYRRVTHPNVFALN